MGGKTKQAPICSIYTAPTTADCKFPAWCPELSHTQTAPMSQLWHDSDWSWVVAASWKGAKSPVFSRILRPYTWLLAALGASLPSHSLCPSIPKSSRSKLVVVPGTLSPDHTQKSLFTSECTYYRRDMGEPEVAEEIATPNGEFRRPIQQRMAAGARDVRRRSCSGQWFSRCREGKKERAGKQRGHWGRRASDEKSKYFIQGFLTLKL